MLVVNIIQIFITNYELFLPVVKLENLLFCVFAWKVLLDNDISKLKTCYKLIRNLKTTCQKTWLNPPIPKPERAQGRIARLKALHCV